MTAEEHVNNTFTKQIINEDIYASKIGIVESHIIFARYHVQKALEAALEDLKQAVRLLTDLKTQ